MQHKKLIRFDWAIKNILKHPTNFVILGVFLTVVLGEPVTIQEILESESLKQKEDDRFNQVDLLVKNQKDEYMIIEVQNNKEYDYFQRMLYGTSELIAQYIHKGQSYADVKKVYSITVAYSDLGQDYVYHGKTTFLGNHHRDKLSLASDQVELFKKNQVHEIYPEYWVIKADQFDDRISDKFDEWIYFLKNSEIPDECTAPGLQEAGEILLSMSLSEEEHRRYTYFEKRLRDVVSEKFTQEADFAFRLKEERQEGREEGLGQVALSPQARKKRGMGDGDYRTDFRTVG